MTGGNRNVKIETIWLARNSYNVTLGTPISHTKAIIW
jgi:hypothetical protein